MSTVVSFHVLWRLTETMMINCNNQQILNYNKLLYRTEFNIKTKSVTESRMYECVAELSFIRREF
jgi:hypothetical protein